MAEFLPEKWYRRLQNVAAWSAAVSNHQTPAFNASNHDMTEPQQSGTHSTQQVTGSLNVNELQRTVSNAQQIYSGHPHSSPFDTTTTRWQAGNNAIFNTPMAEVRLQQAIQNTLPLVRYGRRSDSAQHVAASIARDRVHLGRTYTGLNASATIPTPQMYIVPAKSSRPDVPTSLALESLPQEQMSQHVGVNTASGQLLHGSPQQHMQPKLLPPHQTQGIVQHSQPHHYTPRVIANPTMVLRNIQPNPRPKLSAQQVQQTTTPPGSPPKNETRSWESVWKKSMYHVLYKMQDCTFVNMSETDFAMMYVYYDFKVCDVPGTRPIAELTLDIDYPTEHALRDPVGMVAGRNILRGPHERILAEINFWQLGPDVGAAREAGWIKEVWVLGPAVKGEAVTEDTGGEEGERQLIVPPSLGVGAKFVGVAHKL